MREAWFLVVLLVGVTAIVAGDEDDQADQLNEILDKDLDLLQREIDNMIDTLDNIEELEYGPAEGMEPEERMVVIVEDGNGEQEVEELDNPDDIMKVMKKIDDLDYEEYSEEYSDEN